MAHWAGNAHAPQGASCEDARAARPYTLPRIIRLPSRDWGQAPFFARVERVKSPVSREGGRVPRTVKNGGYPHLLRLWPARRIGRPRRHGPVAARADHSGVPVFWASDARRRSDIRLRFRDAGSPPLPTARPRRHLSSSIRECRRRVYSRHKDRGLNSSRRKYSMPHGC